MANANLPIVSKFPVVRLPTARSVIPMSLRRQVELKGDEKKLKQTLDSEVEVSESKILWKELLEATYWGGPFCAPAFSYVFEVQKRDPSLSYCFVPISIALRPSRPASKPALTCFVLLSMVL